MDRKKQLPKKELAFLLIALLIAGGLIMPAASSCRRSKAVLEIIDPAGTELFYKNPLGVNGIGDPYVLKTGDNEYYCYPTSSPDGYYAYRSENLIDFQRLPQLVFKPEDSWSYKDYWAPEVVFHDGEYLMYYTARQRGTGRLLIGLAKADSPEGPFTDTLGKPFLDPGYAVIDAHVFIDDDGSAYMYFARDCSEQYVNYRNESHIYGIRLADNLKETIGEPVLLTRPDLPWEFRSGSYVWNEGPNLLKHDNKYYLFYSANYFGGRDYSVGYAVAGQPLGPYTKPEANRILYTTYLLPDISGSGHNSTTVSPDGQEIFAVYHTHTDPAAGGGNRQMALDRLVFTDDGRVYINGPTNTWQLKPGGTIDAANIASLAKMELESGNIADREFLIDGVMPQHPADSGMCSTLTGDSEGEVSIVLDFQDKMLIQGVMLYLDPEQPPADAAWAVELDDYRTMPVVLTGGGSRAAIICFTATGTSKISINLSGLATGSNIRIGELVIIGRSI